MTNHLSPLVTKTIVSARPQAAKPVADFPKPKPGQEEEPRLVPRRCFKQQQ